MAGSRKDFVYETDSGRLYAVLLDQSNSSLESCGLPLYVDQVDPLLPTEFLTRQPVGLRLRFLIAVDTLTGNTRKLVCGTTTCNAWTGSTNSIELPNFNLLEPTVYTILRRIQERQFFTPINT